MNVDKFGHHIHKRMRLSEVFDLTDKTILKSPDGHFNLQNNRLRGVTAPIDADDVANKGYVDQVINKLASKTEVEVFVSKVKQVIMKMVENKMEDLFTKTIAHVDQSVKNAYADKSSTITHDVKATSG